MYHRVLSRDLWVVGTTPPPDQRSLRPVGLESSLSPGLGLLSGLVVPSSGTGNLDFPGPTPLLRYTLLPSFPPKPCPETTDQS